MPFGVESGNRYLGEDRLKEASLIYLTAYSTG